MALALTTGASSGLGADFARLAAADGYDLILSARRADRLDALANELRAQSGCEVIPLPADLTMRDGAAHRRLLFVPH